MGKPKKEEAKELLKEEVKIQEQGQEEQDVLEKNRHENTRSMFVVDLQSETPITRCDVPYKDLINKADKYHNTLVEAQAYAKNELLDLKASMDKEKYEEKLLYIQKFS